MVIMDEPSKRVSQASWGQVDVITASMVMFSLKTMQMLWAVLLSEAMLMSVLQAARGDHAEVGGTFFKAR